MQFWYVEFISCYISLVALGFSASTLLGFVFVLFSLTMWLVLWIENVYLAIHYKTESYGWNGPLSLMRIAGRWRLLSILVNLVVKFKTFYIQLVNEFILEACCSVWSVESMDIVKLYIYIYIYKIRCQLIIKFQLYLEEIQVGLWVRWIHFPVQHMILVESVWYWA